MNDVIRIDDLRAPRLDGDQRAALDYVATLDIDFDEDAMLAAAPRRHTKRLRVDPARKDDLL